MLVKDIAVKATAQKMWNSGKPSQEHLVSSSRSKKNPEHPNLYRCHLPQLGTLIVTQQCKRGWVKGYHGNVLGQKPHFDDAFEHPN